MENTQQITAPLVSVIVPAYNAEKLIARSIDSVLAQGYKHLELIVVNDGSTDTTASIIDRYAAEDSRVRAIHIPNCGAMLARKMGIDRAQGYYIQHLDGDDELLPGAIEALVAKAEETQADLVVAPFYFCYEDGRREASLPPTSQEMEGLAYLGDAMRSKTYWCVWNKFMKRSLYADCNVQFFEDVHMMEDFLAVMQLLLCNPRLVMIEQPIINYYVLSNSISHCTKTQLQRYKHYCSAHEVLRAHITRKGLDDYFHEALLSLEVEQFLVGFLWGDIPLIQKLLLRASDFLDANPQMASQFSARDLRYIKLRRISPYLVLIKLLARKLRFKK